MRKPKNRAPGTVKQALSADYVAARFYLLIEALCNGWLAPSRYELDWATAILENLDLPEESFDEAVRDHDEMVGHWDRPE